MAALRTDQLDLLAVHRERAFDVLVAAAAAYEGRLPLRETDEGHALLAHSAELLASVGVSAAAAVVEQRRILQEEAEARGLVRLGAAGVFPHEVIGSLKRRRLPFGPAEVELLLDLGTSTMDPDSVFARSFEVLSFGVSAAANLLRVQQGAAPVVGALERAGAAIDALDLTPTSDAGRLRRRVRELVAANVPGGLLDLSVIDGPDAWSTVAADVLRRHAERWDGVHELLALLAAARSTRPSRAWRQRSVALAADHGDYGVVLRQLLEPILEIDLTSSGVPWPPVWLLAPGNEVLARGATWATADVEEPWVTPLLGRLALRCAAPSPHPTVTTALARGVAGAAVETLATIGTPEANAELQMLLGEVRRRDLLKRIALLVDEQADDTSARDERIRLEKQRAVQRRADPEPQERQRAASAFVRRDLGPVLLAAGFDDAAGRTFWRALDDRVEVLHCKAHRGGLTLRLGIWFRFVPRKVAVPQRDGRERPAEFGCDVRGDVHAWHDDLVSASAKAERWFARWRPLPVVLRRIVDGSQSEDAWGWGAPSSPHNAFLAGYVARETGELGVARVKLAQAATYFRDRLEEHRESRPADVTADWESWVATIEQDATG